MARDLASLPGLKDFMLRSMALYKSTVEDQWGLPTVEDYPHDHCAVSVLPSLGRIKPWLEGEPAAISYYKVEFHREEVNLFGEIFKVWVKR